MPSSLLIKNGTVVDGTGAKPRRADVLIEDDRIVAVGSGLSAKTVLDVAGKVVAPGFIDTHSHADSGLLDDPDAKTQVRQGITTAVVGQDGGHHLPLAEWLREVEAKRTSLNIASFVGHGTVRGKVLGTDFKRAATAAEVRLMRALVATEMKAGALGLSSGVEYDPGLYATTEELIALAEVAGVYNGIYISHVRDEENEALESFDELIRVAAEAHLPAQISHIKLGSSPVWGKAGTVFARMAAAAKRGLDITADVYPYTYWQSSIIVIIPTRDWGNRALWETGLGEIGGPKNVLVTGYSPEPGWQGKTIEALAAQEKKDAITLIQEMVNKTNGAVGVVVTAMQERDLRAFIAHPRIMFCTDGGLHGTHPRGAGSYPRVLGKYVRDERVLPLEEAIRKMTSLPAWRMGFPDRGILAPGNKADIVVFDPKTIRDTATTKDPQAKPVGLTDVLVNGVPVLKSGTHTAAHPGAVLRRTPAP